MSQTYGVSQQLSVPPSPVHIQEKPGYVRRVDDIYLAPDIEDLRIEKLLLKGVRCCSLTLSMWSLLLSSSSTDFQCGDRRDIRVHKRLGLGCLLSTTDICTHWDAFSIMITRITIRAEPRVYVLG